MEERFSMIFSHFPKHSSVIYLNFFKDGTVNTANGREEVDVRVLAANSADIEKALIDGNFNEELYHYINVLRISVPSLKERAGDILYSRPSFSSGIF